MRMAAYAGLAAVLARAPGADGQTAPPSSLDEVGSELVRVEALEDQGVVEVVVGPVDLPSGMGHLRLPIQLARFPLDGWIHGFEVEMRAPDGRELPRELLHHVNLIDPDSRELFSPTARRVMAAGNETRTQRLPGLLGYPIDAGTRLLVVSMFSNPTGRDYEDATLRVRLFFSGEGEGVLRPLDIYPFYVDVMGPVGEKDFPVPPGRTQRTWEGSPAIDGRLLAIGGHLHRYAVEIRLEDVTEERVIWRAEPELDAEGSVVGVPTSRFLWRLGLPLRADHVYRAVVVYENPTDGPAPTGGMGAIGGVVWAPRGVEWPEFDRRNEAYAADLRNILAAPHQAAEHGHHGHGAAEDGHEEPDAGPGRAGESLPAAAAE